jgi:hypothetical protein
MPQSESQSKYVRCRLCGHRLPGWLPILRAPDTALLIHHFSAMHMEEFTPYLLRMATECLDTVVMELCERVEGDDRREP